MAKAIPLRSLSAQMSVLATSPMALTKLPTVDNRVLINVVPKVTAVCAKVLTGVVAPVIEVDRIPEITLKIPEVNPPKTPTKEVMIVPRG